MEDMTLDELDELEDDEDERILEEYRYEWNSKRWSHRVFYDPQLLFQTNLRISFLNTTRY